MKAAVEQFLAQEHGPVAIVVTEMVLQQQYRFALVKNIFGDDLYFAKEQFLQHSEIRTVKPKGIAVGMGFNHAKQL
jgi:hypothetical protein